MLALKVSYKILHVPIVFANKKNQGGFFLLFVWEVNIRRAAVELPLFLLVHQLYILLDSKDKYYHEILFIALSYGFYFLETQKEFRVRFIIIK